MVHARWYYALDWIDSTRSSSFTGTLRKISIRNHSFHFSQTVVYNLISWESIDNTSEWIDKQIPTVLTKNAFRSKISINTYDAESITQAYCYLVSGVCFSLALKYAGTWNEQTANIIVSYLESDSNNKWHTFIVENIFQTISSLYRSSSWLHW